MGRVEFKEHGTVDLAIRLPDVSALTAADFLL